MLHQVPHHQQDRPERRGADLTLTSHGNKMQTHPANKVSTACNTASTSHYISHFAHAMAMFRMEWVLNNIQFHHMALQGLPAPPVLRACRMRPPPAAGCGPVYLPSWASELALARLLKMSCAFCLLFGSPPQACSITVMNDTPPRRGKTEASPKLWLLQIFSYSTYGRVTAPAMEWLT